MRLVHGVELLFLMVALTPAPKQRNNVDRSFIGEWEASWGAAKQGMSFSDDGFYDSPQFGGGPWSYENGRVRFVERGSVYVMTLTLERDKDGTPTLTGNGSRVTVSDDGVEHCSNAVSVKLRKRTKGN